MPTSYYQAIPHVMQHIQMEAPKSILDIGVGFGKYGVLCREVLEVAYGRYHRHQWQVRIDGVEAYKDYRNPIYEHVYDKVYYQDIRELVHQLPSYDVILLIDVIEHMPKEEGLLLVEQLLEHTTKVLLISTPLYPDPQGDYAKNSYERHCSRWAPLDFRSFDFSYHVVPVGDGGPQVFKLYPRPKEATPFPVDSVWDRPLSLSGPLRIAYVLPHHNLTGGMKMLLEQVRMLQERHHKVRVLYRGNPGDPVLPTWANLRVDDAVIVPSKQSYLGYISDCDVVVAGWVEQLPELSQARTPVLYWEQGNEWLFGEVGSPTREPLMRRYVHQCYTQPVALAAVSPLVQDLLRVRYGRKSFVIPNGIDTDAFRPGHPPGNNTILLVGNPSLRFKGFDVALRALGRAWNAGYRFKVNWVCHLQPRIHGLDFPVHYVVNPPQDELPKWYRQADLFLFSSWYEGFGMPPLEAMASGVPVVATSCGGIDAYVIPGVNALLVEPGDIDSMAAAIGYLLDDPEGRAILSAGGRETALRFRWQNTISCLEQALSMVASMQNESDKPGRAS